MLFLKGSCYEEMAGVTNVNIIEYKRRFARAEIFYDGIMNLSIE